MGELADGNPMFPGDSDIDQINCITKVLGNLPEELVNMFYKSSSFKGKELTQVTKPETLEKKYLGKLGPIAIDFMKGLLEMDPTKRLNNNTVFKHKYFDCFNKDDKNKNKKDEDKIKENNLKDNNIKDNNKIDKNINKVNFIKIKKEKINKEILNVIPGNKEIFNENTKINKENIENKENKEIFDKKVIEIDYNKVENKKENESSIIITKNKDSLQNKPVEESDINKNISILIFNNKKNIANNIIEIQNNIPNINNIFPEEKKIDIKETKTKNSNILNNNNSIIKVLNNNNTSKNDIKQNLEFNKIDIKGNRENLELNKRNIIKEKIINQNLLVNLNESFLNFTNSINN
jgi:cyclin-dependent kinase-like